MPLKVSYFAEGTFKENERYKSNIYTVEAEVKSDAIYGAKIYIYFENENAGEISYALGDQTHTYKFKPGTVATTPEINFTIFVINFQEIKNQQNAVKGNSQYFVVNNIDQLANQYFPRLGVRLLSDAAKTIEISFQDNNAAKTTDMVNAMATQFIDYDKEKKGESAQKILTFLEEQLSVVFERLRTAETSIYSFKKENKVSEFSGR
jgi:hypothetical protein